MIYLGITAANGVVIATEKKLPSILVDEASVSNSFKSNHRIVVLLLRIFIISSHCGLG